MRAVVQSRRRSSVRKNGSRSAFTRSILGWFRTNRRDLPWRKTRDPYRILVSEVMLQQTQVSRVMPKYREFVRRFPTVQALAQASQAKVVRAWAGLGYNRRAVSLLRAAKVVVEKFDGNIPRNLGILERLPGIGPYTARAVALFAFDAPVAMVDTNIRRVLTRYFHGVKDVPEAKLRRHAESLVPAGKGWVWGHDLMDFGALVCTARDPKCESCPLRASCKAYPIFQKLRLKGEVLLSVKRKSESFKESNRFYRGRIIDELRARSLSGDELWHRLYAAHPVMKKRKFERALRELVKEGFIERAKAQYRLKG